ncbi:MAG: hypothetical protein ACKPEA_16745, partial [Planctomycetota bacterium]
MMPVRWLVSIALTLTATIGAPAADPPRGPGSVVESTMSTLSAEAAAMTAPGDEIGRELTEARRTWRAVAIEVLRAASTEPWASQAAFVTGMRIADGRATLDATMARALSRPRSDADVVRLAATARAFTERGPAAVHALAADDPARIDAAVAACLAGLAEALSPFAADDAGARGFDADLWPSAEGGGGSTKALERFMVALEQFAPKEPWVVRAKSGAAMLRQAAGIAAFRPEAESIAEAALGSIRLLRALEAVTWIDEDTKGSLRTSCASALADLDRTADRERTAVELKRLRGVGALLDDLSVLCAGRGGRPP